MTEFYFGINFVVRSIVSRCWVFVHVQISDRNVLRIISYFLKVRLKAFERALKNAMSGSCIGCNILCCACRLDCSAAIHILDISKRVGQHTDRSQHCRISIEIIFSVSISSFAIVIRVRLELESMSCVYYFLSLHCFQVKAHP